MSLSRRALPRHRYFPAEDEAPIVRAAAAKLIKLTWSLFCVAGKVNPKGLAIVTEKLIIVKPKEEVSLMNLAAKS